MTILSGVSFEVAAGQAVLLQGPNGSGKTTLLRTISGLQPPVEGTVSASSDSIAYAAHADGIKATLTVAENLEFWASLFGTRGIDQALESFELTELKSRFAGRLSAGQKRRLGLARLLVTDRPIWALDEPTVSLDRSAVALFAGVIASHLKNGGAALVATHIDLGFNSDSIDLSKYRAQSHAPTGFDEAFT